ncbi:MAG TPA: helix-turn-helix domain-containing protein [Thermohalobaculum sp.]|nr:helix-turn-helix domain-containing protein [Thermohalobaculum sp.]
MIHDGGSRAEAAATGGVGRQIVRGEEDQETVRWTVSPTNVVRFNAEGPAGLVSRMLPGNASKLSAAQRAELARLVERGPIPAVDGVVRWRLGA